MDVLMGSFPKFSWKLFFWNANGWMLQNSSNIFFRTPMDASEWISKWPLKCFAKQSQQCGIRAKRNNSYSSKQNWAIEKK